MIEKELESIHVVFPLIGANPDCVDSTDSDASDCEKDAQGPHSLDRRTWRRSWLIVVGYQGYSEAHGDQSVYCHPRDGLLVKDEVDDGNDGGQEDSSDLIKGNGGDLEGDIHADDVHCHCDGERKHIHDGNLARLEHADLRTREEVERRCCDEEVEGREGCLTL